MSLRAACLKRGDMTVERPRSPTNVDITCAQCGKPMMMLRFNYTSLERGFESISLRCQYCKADETRPWPKPEEMENPKRIENKGEQQALSETASGSEPDESG